MQERFLEQNKKNIKYNFPFSSHFVIIKWEEFLFMKLEKAHIENFGKLKNFDVQFNEESNLLLENNGWGKSTLAAFIRIMFFGFQNENKSSVVENERKKYDPWQGGVYGGQLTFAVGKKKYRIERTFGKTKSEDRFVLYDAIKNLPSVDYSENIGEEVFSIDAESFMRSIFIGQDDCETNATIQIQKRIGNVAKKIEDIEDYEKAWQRLQEKILEMSPENKEGSLYKLEKSIAGVESILEKSQGVEEKMDELQQKEKDCLEKRKECLAKQEQLSTELSQKGKRKEQAMLHQEYLTRTEEFTRAKENYDRKRKDFPKTVPQIEILQVIRQMAHEIQPEQEEIHIKEQKFADKVPSRSHAEEVLDVSILPEVKLKLVASGLFFVLCVVGAVALRGIVLAFSISAMLGAVAGLLFFIRALLEIKELVGEREEGSFPDQSEEVWSEEEREEWEELEKLKIEHQKKVDTVEKYLRSTGFSVNEDMVVQLDQMLSDVTELSRLKKTKQTSEEILKKFIAANPGCEREKEEEIVPEKENRELAEMVALIKKHDRELASIKEEIHNLQRSYDERMEIQALYERAKEEYREEKERYDILCKSKLHLEEARRNFGTKYMEPIKVAFDKYYVLLTGKSNEEFVLDDHLNLSLKSAGKQREISLMSEGYRDLIGLCMRMALIETMYVVEKPFLILDDPFVNLDNSKMGEAMKFLEKISKEYQMIYFSCHSSRMPRMNTM